MKTRNLPLLLCLFSLYLLVSCDKNKEEADPETETTFTLSENQAISESLADDANTVFFEAAASEGLSGFRTTQVVESTNTLSCATVTVTPQNTFPKTIVIDFGAGCTSADGVTRKGKINIVLSDTVRHHGTTAVMTFDGYHVQGFKVEGTITWTNTSTQNGLSWTREIDNGKVTAPGGNYYWLHEGTKYVTQSAGANTPLNLLDDVFTVTGNHTVTNPSGDSRSATITEALEKKTICGHVSKGKIKIEGPHHFAILDYGDGTCDRVATISIDGNAPRTFLLP
ncbi:MAG TPA: hypothetical protein VF476_10880 [Chitinophagaceae bacterium]